MDDDADLRDAVRALAERVAALEGSRAPVAPPAAPDDETYWALDGLVARRGQDETTARGSVMMVGSVEVPTGGTVSWQQEAGSEGLIEVEWGDRATAFAALGHPVRVELLRRILQGVRTTAALAALDELGTTGQLHHHLRQLVAAGWVRQSGRGSYEIPAGRIVPLLVCIVAAER
ncbi:ArsR/SmtB family transcription factor [Microbacterium sp. gxy059]|uniref:ArsR/SmtB family transcription factor n=1 Tax=Microbacterium sp. gxy059 TaxID=2957199 RepID=UPI003D98857E